MEYSTCHLLCCWSAFLPGGGQEHQDLAASQFSFSVTAITSMLSMAKKITRKSLMKGCKQGKSCLC